MSVRGVPVVALVVLVVVAGACGSGGGGKQAPLTPGGSTPRYTVGGSVTGLVGTVVLQDDGADDLALSADGAFTFAAAVAEGGAYAVTVKTQPAGQVCTVAGGSGTVSGGPVTGVTVTCLSYFRVGGSVTGLAGTVVLQDNGADDLALSADGVFTFATSIASGGTYAVTVKTQPVPQDCSVAHGSGTVAGADVTDVAVTCRGWDPAQVVTSIGGDSYYPQFAFAPGGDVVAVWREIGPTLTTWGNNIPEIRTSRLDAATRTWSASERLDTATAITSYQGLPAIVVVDPAGNAVVAWQQVQPDYLIHLFAARQPAGGSWGALGQIDTGSVDGTRQRVAIDGNGNALFVWKQPTFSMSAAGYPMARRWSPSGGWDAAPVRIQDDPNLGAEDPRVAIDGAGNAFAVWWDGYHDTSVMGAVLPAGGAWGAPVLLEGATGYLSAPALAVNAAGDAIVAFTQVDGSGARSVYARRYDGQLGTWSAPALVESSGGGADRLVAAVAMDAAGNAIAAWRLSGTSELHASRHDVGTGLWDAPATLGTSAYDANFKYLSLAMDPATGDAIAVWNHSYTWNTSDLFANRYVAGQGWQGAVPLESRNGFVYDPVVGIDASGRSLVLWAQQLGAVTRIWYTRYR